MTQKMLKHKQNEKKTKRKITRFIWKVKNNKLNEFRLNMANIIVL